LHDAHVEVRACAVLCLSAFILTSKEYQKASDRTKRMELFLPLLYFTVVNDGSLMVRREMLCVLQDYLNKKIFDADQYIGVSFLLLLEINSTPYQKIHTYHSIPFTKQQYDMQKWLLNKSNLDNIINAFLCSSSSGDIYYLPHFSSSSTSPISNSPIKTIDNSLQSSPRYFVNSISSSSGTNNVESFPSISQQSFSAKLSIPPHIYLSPRPERAVFQHSFCIFNIPNLSLPLNNMENFNSPPSAYYQHFKHFTGIGIDAYSILDLVPSARIPFPLASRSTIIDDSGTPSYYPSSSPSSSFLTLSSDPLLTSNFNQCNLFLSPVIGQNKDLLYSSGYLDENCEDATLINLNETSNFNNISQLPTSLSFPPLPHHLSFGDS
jgi:hypothetical protein